MTTCDLLPPRFNSLDFKGCTGCTRERGHDGPHHDADVTGPIAWEDDYECDCCSLDEQDRCAVFWRRSEIGGGDA